MRLASPFRLAIAATALAVLAACASGPARRVSEPTAQIQQLTVRADGGWDVQLRLQNYSSIPMRFDSVRLTLDAGGQTAGDLVASPAVDIGPESADVIDVRVQPATTAKLAIADALGAGRAVDYRLEGQIVATPERKSQQTFDVRRSSTLNPAPGLPGVLR